MAAVVLPSPSQMRLVSLLPAATEIVYALGCGELVVGRSHECDYPANVATLPRCTKSSISNSYSSDEINRTVQERLSRGEPLYELCTDELKRLKPSLIFTQRQCEVCAIDEVVVSKELARHGIDAAVCALSGRDFAGVLEDIHRVAEALGVSKRGELLVSELRSAMSPRELPTEAPRTLLFEWLSPLMAAGNWMPELVHAAGGYPLLASVGSHSSFISPEDIVSANPDCLVLIPCGFDIARTLSELSILTDTHWWPELRAVKQGAVFVVDGNALGNRPGPRLADTVRVLNEIVLGRPSPEPGLWCKVGQESCKVLGQY